LFFTKLIKAPTAISAKDSPIIKRSNGEKFEICSFAFAINDVVNPVGNSIITARQRACPECYYSINYLIALAIVNRSILTIANAMNTPEITAISGKNA